MMFKLRMRHAVTALTVLTVLWVVQLGVVFFQQPIHNGGEQVASIADERADDVKKVMGADLEYLKVPYKKEGRSDLDSVDAIPVFIVEEHHEVLRYWFGSADKKIIPKEGNTLLHIDGHSDAAIPFVLNIIPLYRRPKNRAEVYNMMQRNDVFIVAAGLGRLINRYIWVFPPWDVKNHETDYLVHDVESGLLMLNGSTLLCGCAKSRSNGSDSLCVRQDPDKKDEFLSVKINRNDCDLKFSGVVEEVSEKKAIELLNKGGWLTDNDNVILDIDEDYYGCETVLQTLETLNITIDVVNNLSTQLGYLLCPLTVAHETAADAFFHALIEVIVEMKSKCQKSTFKHRCSNLNVQNALIGMIPNFLEVVYQEKAGEMLCNGNEDGMNGLMVQTVIKTLVKLTIPQLKMLAEVGVCLETAVTSFMESSDGIRVCHGSNLPNETVVLYHSPSPIEVQERTRNLHSLLHSGSFSPNIVTICRSIRDDYTPHSHFHKIERDILKVLHESFSDVHWATVYYDRHLLGGKQGWPGRHN